MTETTEHTRIVAVSMVVLAAVAIAVALAYTRAVMVPFVLAVFVSYLVMPMIDFLRIKLHVPRVLAVLIALLTALGLLTLLGMLIAMSTRSLLSKADVYQEKITSTATQLFSVLDRFGLAVATSLRY